MRETHISYSISLSPSDCIHIHFWQNIYKNKNCLVPQIAVEIALTQTEETILTAETEIQTTIAAIALQETTVRAE